MAHKSKQTPSFLDPPPPDKSGRLRAGSPQQNAFWRELQAGTSHVALEARAGTGKSSSCREGIWRLLDRDRSHRSAYVAFNKAIAREFGASLPPGATATTMHSAGLAALHAAFPGIGDPATFKMFDIVDGMLTRRDAATRKVKTAAVKLAGLCKGYLIDGDDPDALDRICAVHGVDVRNFRSQAFDLVPKILARCREMTSVIDFSDMIWLPVVLDLDFPEIDALFVDEAQDLDPCQHALVRRIAGAGRLVMVGDSHQAIYAFRGADSSSMETLSAHLAGTKRGLTRLPLTMTRRCPRSHVELASRIVGDFEALPEAPEGNWAEDVPVDDALTPGVMALCRTNAPLLAACYRLAARGVKVAIQGRDIGDGLAKFVDGFEASDVAELLRKVEVYRASESDRLSRLENGEGAIEKIHDHCNCVLEISRGCSSPSDVSAKIKAIFVDVTPESQPGLVLLSSVHRAKGRESDQVAILCPDLMPHRMARTADDVRQEMNLIYVAATRSKDSLAFCGPLPLPLLSPYVPDIDAEPETPAPEIDPVPSAPVPSWKLPPIPPLTDMDRKRVEYFKLHVKTA